MNNKKVSQSMKEWKAFKTGKLKLRTLSFDSKSGKREIKYKSFDDIRKEKAERLKRIRKDELHLSQSQLAKMLHVSVRTLQGWEIGKSSVPEPVFILIELVRDVPAVRKKLAVA